MTFETLPNGMRVVLLPDEGPDVAAAYLWINVGSTDEAPGMEGAAHFIEHLVFKGTERYGVGECAAAIEAMGGDLNAWTGFDETVFHATVRGAAAAGAVEVLADMMRTARFDAEELERERGVVIEEIRGGDDDVGLVLSEALYAAAWPGDPYGRSIIGTTASVRALPRAALLDFYTQRYVPANACIAVAGRFDEASVRACIRARFAGGPAAPPRGRTRRAAPRGGVAIRLRRRFDTHLLRVAFPAVSQADERAPAFDLLTSALGGNSATPLIAALRAHPGCFDANVDFEAESRGGLLVIEAHVAPGKEDAVLDVATGILAAAAAGAIDRGDLARARVGLAAERRFRHQTVDGRAHEACYGAETYGDPEAWRAYDARVAAVSAVQIQELAAEVLRPETALVVALSRRAGSPRPRWAPLHPPATPSGVVRHVLPGGVRVLVERDSGSIGAIRIVGLGGQLAERPGTRGRTNLWARTISRGAGGLAAEPLGRAASGLGGGLGAAAGRSSQGLRAEFPAEGFAAGLELILLTLLDPTFDAVEVERARAAVLDELASRDDEPGERLSLAVWAAACPGHPWGLDPSGTPATLAAIGPGSLRAFHRAWARPGNLVVGLTGDLDVEYALGRLTAAAGALRAGPAAATPGRLVHATAPRRLSLRSGRDQAHLSVAWAGIGISDPRTGVLDVLIELLGGQSGRLFMELREAEGLAYAVGAESVEGLPGGLVNCSMATDPARLDAAERGLMASIARVAAGDFSPEEVRRAQASVLGAAEAQLQTAGARASEAAYAELYGLDGARYRQQLRRAEGVSHPDVAALAAELFARPLVVGRLSPR
ncbi:MAG: insulinase family protein [Myxococcales bacterium]|nr:insulinase family protein [Myxococcales bacterium]